MIPSAFGTTGQVLGLTRVPRKYILASCGLDPSVRHTDITIFQLSSPETGREVLQEREQGWQ